MNFMLYDDGCGRYSLRLKAQMLKEHYRLLSAPKDLPQSFDVKPGQVMPVIIQSDADKPELEMMRWGLTPVWAKDPKIGYKLFNARDDHVFTGNIWKQVIYKKRALIPATGYFEWTKPPSKETSKQKFYFKPKGLDVFSFAGIWSAWKDSEGNVVKTYSIITTEPNKEAATVHNRMPVILHPEDEASWIEPSHTDRSDIEPLLRPWEDNGIEVVEVGIDVADWAYDDPRRIAPLNSK